MVTIYIRNFSYSNFYKKNKLNININFVMRKLQIIRDLLYKIIEDIDTGNSNISDD